MGFKLKADQTAMSNKLPIHTSRVQFKLEKGPHNNIIGFTALVDGKKQAFPVIGKATPLIAYNNMTKWVTAKLK